MDVALSEEKLRAVQGCAGKVMIAVAKGAQVTGEDV